ncbi:MAG TPA: protein kinase [Sandaracinaceae bacterium LLY-WYZ-13_1]|nr:protein kinase [Sandaracinaceae bacterium LLY-WYZ-13_1]
MSERSDETGEARPRGPGPEGGPSAMDPPPDTAGERPGAADEQPDAPGDRTDAAGERPDASDAALASADTVAAPDLGTATTLDAGAVGAAAQLGVTAGDPARYDRSDDDAELGRGAIGRVLRVLDRHLGREVALKELLDPGERVGSGSAASPASSSGALRFLREARLTGQLEHPSIVPVHELGVRPDGTLYYTMKVVRGRTLRAALADAGSLADRLHHVGAFQDICQGVAYAHSRGVVHRDLKPDNVMLGEFGETVVLDWGLAKAHGQEDPVGRRLERSADRLAASDGARTVEGAVIGTPSYMSPEQARGDLDAVDERSDVWSLGAILFELLTGRPPLTGDGALAVVRKAVEGKVPAVRAVAPDAPADLAAIADKALARRPEDRYPSAAELAREVEAWRDGRQVGAYSYSSLELVRRFVARNRAASAAAAIALIGLLVGSGAVYASYLEAERQRADAERERTRAETSERAAHAALAAAYLEKAERALATGDPGGAAVYAAAALVHDPLNPRSPYHDPSAQGGGERVVLAYSHLFAARTARRYRYARALRVPEDRLEAVRGDGSNPATRGYSAAAFSPDGRTIAAATLTGWVVLFDVEGDTPPRIERHVEGSLMSLSWSPDGSRLAAVAWDAATPVRRVDDWSEVTSIGRLAPGNAVAFSPDGRRIGLGTQNGDVRLLPVTPDGPAPEAVYAPGLVHTLVWSADGARLALADESGAITFWDVAERTILRTETLTSSAYALDFAPDGRRAVASTIDDKLAVLPVDPARPMDVRWLERPAISVLWSADGERWVHGGIDGEVVLRDAESHLREATLHAARRATRLVAARDDLGYVAAFGSEPAGRLFRAYAAPGASHLGGFAGTTTHLALAPDGETLVALERDVPITLVDLAEATRLEDAPTQRVTYARGPDERPTTVAIHPDGDRFAFADETGRVGLVSLPDGERIEWVVEQAPFEGGWWWWPLAFGPDGDALFLRTELGTLSRYDLEDRRLEPLGRVEGALNAMDAAPDGTHVATGGGDGMVRIWPVDGGEPRVLEGHGGLVSSVRYSPDGRWLASAGLDAILRIWDAESGALRATLEGHDEWINRVDWSPDGRWLASASDDQTVRLWDVEAERLLHVYFSQEQALVVRFGPDGRSLYYNDGLRVTRVEVDLSDRDRDPTELLSAAERHIGMRLSDRALVPVER